MAEAAQLFREFFERLERKGNLYLPCPLNECSMRIHECEGRDYRQCDTYKLNDGRNNGR